MIEGHIRIRCARCRKDGSNERTCKSHKEKRYNLIIPGAKSTTWRTLDDANKQRIKTLNELNQGIYKALIPATVKEIADKQLASVRPNCRPACYSNYQFVNEKHIFPYIGSKPIASITKTMIAEVISKIDHLGYWSKRSLIVRLKAIFLFAESENALKENPTKGLKSPKKNKKVVVNKKREVALSNIQIHQLVNIGAGIPWVELYYEMATYTGMRPSELGGIEISEINLDKAQVHTTQTVYWFKTLEERGSHPKPYIFQPLKSTAADRIIPLTPSLVKKIQIHLINAKQNPHNLLFARLDGDPIRHEIDVNKEHFHGHLKLLKARHEFPAIDFYCLRHTYASMLAEMDVPPMTAKYLMGHEDIQTTMNIYAKVRPDKYGNVGVDIGKKLQAFTALPTDSVSMACQ